MQSTPPLLPISQRPTKELIEDLCLALRDVGVRTYGLPNGEVAISAIRTVQDIYALLKVRDADVQARIERLSKETSWQMDVLLEESLAFPDVVPYVKESDGIRLALRCNVCRVRELPDKEGVWLCDVCLTQAIQSIDSRLPMKGMILFRIFNEEYWCEHANSETVLIAFDDYETLDRAYCNDCLSDERVRRLNIT